jgi:hypothetical protein
MSRRNRWKPRRPQPTRPTLVDPFGPHVVPRTINESCAAVVQAIHAYVEWWLRDWQDWRRS